MSGRRSFSGFCGILLPIVPLEFSYELARAWPRLAWIAMCEAGSSSIRIIHGPAVERGEQWFCEAVWDAPFPDGNLDQTDLVFGSGGRCRRNGITFVSAGSTVDRLQVAVRGNCTFVSNSLPCLLEVIGARLDPTFRGYVELFQAVTSGVNRSLPDLPIDGSSVQLVYYTNLLWDGSQLQQIPKPAERRNFTHFEDYVGFVRAALQRIGENMASPKRTRPYSWLGTISRGYDSPTCAVLTREVGLRRVITLDESRPGVPDDGSDVAKALDLTCVVVSRLAWKSQGLLEPLFLVADAQGKEIMIAGAAAELDQAVLVTGHGGDTAWSTQGESVQERGLPGVYSGLSMTEYRLHSGFIHLPVPFLGWSQLSDLVKLTRSPEMARWNTGGTYSRPICRRLLEHAGVPRGSFGVSKTGASIRFLRGEDPWSKNGKRAFLAWLRTRGNDHALTPRLVAEARLYMLGLGIALWFGQRTRGLLSGAFRRTSRALAERIKKQGLNDLAFIWAVETVRHSYRLPPRDVAETGAGRLPRTEPPRLA